LSERLAPACREERNRKSGAAKRRGQWPQRAADNAKGHHRFPLPAFGHAAAPVPFGTNQSAYAGCRAGLPTWQAHAVKVDANQAIVAARRKRN
jgi:hypothetical protein